MEKENKIELGRIILSSVLLVVVYIVNRNIDIPLWGSLLLYLIPYMLISYDVILEALENVLKGHLFDENFLMVIATVGALCIGFLPNAHEEFLEAVFVMLFFKVGELFEEIAEGKTERSIKSLMDIRPDSANVEREGIITVDPNEVLIGEIIVVKPGERIPLDGIIVEGNSNLDTVALTGESIPRAVKEGDEAFSGCINLNGLLRIKVNKLFNESTASRIIELVESASENKSNSENFITKFARVYTPIVVLSALILAFIPPLIMGNFSSNISVWLNRALTFLVVSCPCALVVSVPLGFFCGIGGASKKGVLIKGANYLETLSKIDTVVFDKTGTLTKGIFSVTAVHPEKYDESHILHYAAHVERYSNHPIAVSLKEAYEDEDDLCDIKEVEEFIGKGIKAKVNEKIVYVGNSKMMAEINIDYKECHHAGTIIHVVIDDEYVGHIVISDEVKTDAKTAILRLKEIGIHKTIMLTGDHENVASEISKQIGIDEYKAELFPKDKVDYVSSLTNVAFVGDGINDAPVLARADIGISMGAMGSDAAIEASDIVLMDDKPSKIVDAIMISRKTLSIVKQNIIFALGIKMIVLILAIFGLAPMYLAVFADVGVTVLAILNATRALRIKNQSTVINVKNE